MAALTLGQLSPRCVKRWKGYGLLWPADIDRRNPPDDGQIFDLLEFAYEFIAEAKDPSYHSYMSHSHYSYDRDAGREKFAHDVNRIFERNGMAFELANGEVMRIAPAVLHETLAATVFKTGDTVLDELLEVSREKFLHRALNVRREALEKLWDAWERLKTVEAGKDKKATAKALLDKAAAEPNFRSRLEQEARELTEIGNEYRGQKHEEHAGAENDNSSLEQICVPKQRCHMDH